MEVAVSEDKADKGKVRVNKIKLKIGRIRLDNNLRRFVCSVRLDE